MEESDCPGIMGSFKSAAVKIPVDKKERFAILRESVLKRSKKRCTVLTGSEEIMYIVFNSEIV